MRNADEVFEDLTRLMDLLDGEDDDDDDDDWRVTAEAFCVVVESESKSRR